MFKGVILGIKSFFGYGIEIPTDAEALCNIDIEILAERLEVEKLARISAEGELPESSAKVPDSSERKISAYFENRMAKITKITNDKLVAFNTALVNTSVNSEIQQIKHISERTKLRLDSLIKEAEKRLSYMRQDHQEYNQYYKKFRYENNLETEAYYPDSRLFYHSLVLLLWLFESFMNGYFFAKGSDLGMLGGISQSFIIAAINIIPAYIFIGGYVVRYINHISILYRVTSYFFVSIYIITIIVFNLFVAHYRDLLSSHPEDAVSLVIDKVITDPVALNDINSWLLFIVGFLFAIIAIVDGYKFDDPYPRYGKIQRRLFNYKESYDEEYDLASTNIDRTRAEYLHDLDIMETQVKDKFSHLFNLASSKPAVVSRYENCIKDHVNVGDVLVHRYRDMNKLIRNTKAPKYFESSWLPERDYQLLGHFDDEERIARAQKAFQTFPKFIQESKKDIERIYTEYMNNLRDVGPERLI